MVLACRDLLQLDWVKSPGCKKNMNEPSQLHVQCDFPSPRSAQLPGQIRSKLVAARSSRSSRVRLAEELRGVGSVQGMGGWVILSM